MKKDKKILIIEDNDGISTALSEVLKDVGFQIEVASNGKEALDKIIHSGPPDLILLDLFLPIMGGLDFWQRLTQIPSLAHIPVIVMSADAFVKRRCQSVKISRFLKKPFELLELLEKIDEVFSREKLKTQSSF